MATSRNPSLRILLAIALILAGFLTAAFFGLLLLIADCTARCQANHEQLVPIALVVLGIGGYGAWRAHRPHFPSPARGGRQGGGSRNF
jgi:hypothetical protein